MTRRKFLSRGAGALAAAAALLVALPATPQSSPDRARAAVRSGQALPLNQILPVVKRRVPGRVVDAELRQGPRGWVYLVKVIDRSGAVQTVTVNAKSKRILGVTGPGRPLPPAAGRSNRRPGGRPPPPGTRRTFR